MSKWLTLKPTVKPNISKSDSGAEFQTHVGKYLAFSNSHQPLSSTNGCVYQEGWLEDCQAASAHSRKPCCDLSVMATMGSSWGELWHLYLLGLKAQNSSVWGSTEKHSLAHVYSEWAVTQSLGRCLVPESCSGLWQALDCSPPGSSDHGISQARIQEWAAISFSRDLLYPALWADSLPLSHQGSPHNHIPRE